MLMRLRWLRLIGLPALVAIGWAMPSAAQTNENGESRVTAKITLGPSDGGVRPMQRGQAITGGGSIDIRQPAADRLIIRMTGSVGACGNLLASAEATLDFYENLQFAVEFSEPGCTGTLRISSQVSGALSGRGKHSTVGVGDAVASVLAGPEPIASVTIPGRAVGCDESLGINATQGPACATIVDGCYQLHQEYRLFAMQPKSCSCGKAIAEFAPTSLSSTWLGLSYPFKDVDKSDFGFEVTIRVVPDQPDS